MKSDVVVIPWDFSDYARAALKYAMQTYPTSNLHVVCVLEYPNPYTYGAYGGPWSADDAETSKQRCFDDFFSEVDPEREKGINFFAIFGDPAEQVIGVAEKENADMILMPTHGRTGIQKLFMGSVAQKVVSHAKCPVLLLPSHWIEDHMPAEKMEQVSN